jgi:hypothetical protein
VGGPVRGDTVMLPFLAPLFVVCRRCLEKRAIDGFV